MKKDYYDLPYPMFKVCKEDCDKLVNAYNYIQEHKVSSLCLVLGRLYPQKDTIVLIRGINKALGEDNVLSLHLDKLIDESDREVWWDNIDLCKLRLVWIKKLIAHQGYTCHDFPILSDV